MLKLKPFLNLLSPFKPLSRSIHSNINGASTCVVCEETNPYRLRNIMTPNQSFLHHSDNLTIQQIRFRHKPNTQHRNRYYAYKFDLIKSLEKYSYAKRMSCPGGRSILQSKILAGKRYLTYNQERVPRKNFMLFEKE